MSPHNVPEALEHAALWSSESERQQIAIAYQCGDHAELGRIVAGLLESAEADIELTRMITQARAVA